MARRKVVRAIFQIIVLVALASPAVAQSRQVSDMPAFWANGNSTQTLRKKTRPVPRNTPDR